MRITTCEHNGATLREITYKYYEPLSQLADEYRKMGKKCWLNSYNPYSSERWILTIEIKEKDECQEN